MPSLINDEVMEVGEVEGEEEHQKVESMNPSLLHILEAQRRKEDLCIEGRDKYVCLHPHSSLCLDTSLQGDPPLGAPLDRRKSKVFFQLWATYAYLAKEGALGEASTAQRIS